MEITQLLAVPAEQALLVAASVGLAALIRAFTGFGFAMLVVPAFSFFLAPGDAVVLSAVLALLLGLLSYRSWWGLFPVAPAKPMVAGSVIGTAIGVWFLASLSVAEFQLWIGVSVVIASVVLARFVPSERAASSPAALATGVASGLMNGAFAIPGPPVILYVVATLSEPVKSRAFLMMFFWCSSVVSLVMFGAAGLVSPRPFQLLWVALPVMWLGNQADYCLTLSRTMRAFCRCQSRSFWLSRLSCCFLP
jgi:uncharacterized membrane protein YfcA